VIYKYHPQSENQKEVIMIQQTIFPFMIEVTKEKLKAHGVLALMAEFNHGIRLKS